MKRRIITTLILTIFLASFSYAYGDPEDCYYGRLSRNGVTPAPKAFAPSKFSRSALVNHQTLTEVIEFHPKKTPYEALSFSSLSEQNEKKKGSVPGSVIGSLLGGAIGFFGGGLLGYEIETDSGCSGDEDDWCGVSGFFFGAAIGESLLMPIGAHAGNGGHGNLPINLLITTGIGGLGLALAASSNEPTTLIAIPVLQLLTSIVVEQTISRSP